jgi:Mg2+/Co2+ transporter CorC
MRPQPARSSGVVLGAVLAVGALLVASADSLLGEFAALLTSLVCIAGGFVAARLLAAYEHRPAGDRPDHDRSEADEQALVDSIIDFEETVAREVMVPRPDMITVDATFRAADVIEVMLLNGYSRLPACGEGIDDIVGLVYAKDLMRAERDGMQELPVADLLRPGVFVPETKRLPELLRDMQREQFHMAIVVDEYGGTAGLVTLEDILEELVGEIVDEYDVEDPMIEPLPGGDALVRARTSVTELNDLLQADLPEGDWDTVGGLLYSRLNHVPVEGETVVVAGWRLTAQRVQGRRIGRVRLSRQLGGSDDGDAAGEGGTSNGAADHDHRFGDVGHVEGNNNHQRRAGDAGAIGGIEAIPFGLLIFVVGTLLIANAWSVIDAKLAVNAAAREATRRYVEAEAGSGSAEQQATEAGLAALEAHGRDPSHASVQLTGLDAPGGSGSLVRCARVTYTASYQVPAVALPWVGGFGHGFHVTARHSELVDPFRDGLPGDATAC